jgi:hypothetical protein
MWQFVSPDDLVRCTRTPKTRAHKFPQFIGRRSPTRVWDDYGDYLFPPLIIGLTQYCCFFYSRVLSEDILNFSGGDILSATNDQVVRTPREVDISGGVYRSFISGVEPAVSINEGAESRVLARNLLPPYPLMASLAD